MNSEKAKNSFSKSQLKSPDFTLPPRKLAIDVIKFNLFKWSCGSWNEEKELRMVNLTCTTCSRNFLMSWPINGSNLKRHYDNQHGGVIDRLIKESDKTGIPLSESNSLDFHSRTPKTGRFHKPSHSIDPFHQIRKGRKSISLQSMVSKINKSKDFNDNKYAKLMLYAITKRNLPFDIFEYPEVKALLEHVFANSLNSSSNKLMRRLLRRLYRTSVGELKDVISHNESHFSITCDPFYSNKTRHFLGITLHFFNNDLQLESYYIGFETLRELLPSGLVLYKHLSNVLEEYKIKDRVVSFTSKNTPTLFNMSQHYSDYHKITHLREYDGDVACVGNVFNSCMDVFFRNTFFKPYPSKSVSKFLHDYTKNNPELEKKILGMRFLPKNLRDIARIVSNNSYLRNFLQDLTQEKGKKNKTCYGPEGFLQDNDSRWLSTYEMLNRFLSFRNEIPVLLQHAGFENIRNKLGLQIVEITDNEWEYISVIRDFLKIFSGPAISLQASNAPTVNLVIPMIALIVKDIESFDSRGNPLIDIAAKEVLQELLSYYPINGENIESMKTICLATVLDPRLKLQIFHQLNFSEGMINNVKNHFFNVFNHYKREYDKEQKKSSKITSSSFKTEREKYSEQFICDTAKNDEYIESRIFGSKNAINNQNEAETYLSDNQTASKHDFMDYYKERKLDFPVIYRMARDILAIPAMSASTEALFSRISEIFPKKLKGITPNTMKSSAILKSRGVLPDKRPVGVEFEFNENEVEAEGTEDDSEENDHDMDSDHELDKEYHPEIIDVHAASEDIIVVDDI